MYRLRSRALVAGTKLLSRRRPPAVLSNKLLSSVAIAARTFSSFDRNSLQGEYGKYAEQYDESIESPETFWKNAASSLEWFQEPQTILQQCEKNPMLHDWFPDGTINTSYNCLDVHVKNGRGDQVALVYDSPVTDTKQQFTYSELLKQVSLFAGALEKDLGVEAGDRVVIYMPLIPQAAIAMLACARIGTY